MPIQDDVCGLLVFQGSYYFSFFKKLLRKPLTGKPFAAALSANEGDNIRGKKSP